MIKVTIIDEYGEVVRFLSMPTMEAIEMNMPPDTFLVSSEPSTPTAKWNGSAWVDRPAATYAYQSWDKATATWVDTRNIEVVRLRKITELNTRRDTAEWSGFTWDGNVFDSDAVSQQRLSLAFSMAKTMIANEEEGSVDWTLQNNTVITLSAADLIEVEGALATHIITTHYVYRTYKAAVVAATTNAEIDGI